MTKKNFETLRSVGPSGLPHSTLENYFFPLKVDD